MAVTMEDLNDIQEMCENIPTHRVLHFNGIYIEPKTVKNAVTALKHKITMATAGIDELNDADLMLLIVLESQKGYCY